jgi:cytochrome P450
MCPNDGDTDQITEDHLAKIPLIKATLKESQRLDGLAPIIGRKLDTDVVIDQYLIPEGV